MRLHTDGYFNPSPARAEIAVVIVQRRIRILKMDLECAYRRSIV